jgi:hypothetical protein
MKSLITRLRYWRHRKFNDRPAPQEIGELLLDTKLRSPQLLAVCNAYANNGCVEWTADCFLITRERVRQYLWKLYHSAYPRKHVDKDTTCSKCGQLVE